MRRVGSLVFFCACLLLIGNPSVYVRGQSLTVPSTWLNTSCSIPRSEREEIGSAAANQLKQSIDPGTGVIADFNEPACGSLFSVLSLQDFTSGNTSNVNSVVPNLEGFITHYGFYGIPSANSDAISWGLAAYYAYRAYKQDALLNISTKAYNSAIPSFITPADAASGTGANRNVTYQSKCNSSTMAGGLFFSPDDREYTLIPSYGVGRFLVLSAYLYEETSQDQYKTMAGLAFEFLMSHMWDGSEIYDSIDAASCNVSSVSDAPGSDETGWLIEGMSIMANVTKNDTLTTMLNTIVPAVVTNPSWSSSIGVLSESNTEPNYLSIRKGALVRGLAEAYRRLPDTDLAKYIEAFITVQYNSLLTNARTPGTDYYTTSWFGPPNSTYNPLGNVAALDVLNAAIMFPPQNVSGNPGNQTNTSASSTSKSVNVGVVVGGVVGGVSFVLAILGGLFLRRHLHNRSHVRELPVLDDNYTVEDHATGFVYANQPVSASVGTFQGSSSAMPVAIGHAPRLKSSSMDFTSGFDPWAQTGQGSSAMQYEEYAPSELPPAYSRSQR